MNPFKRLSLYTNKILDSYQESRRNPKPHVYSVADTSYRQMMMSEKHKSQTILISGESGSGKTECTKIVMSYLTTIGTKHATGQNGSNETLDDNSIMKRVLQSNPVLEAFGNARTIRNDNSSRFGKFVKLGFSHTGSLLGAKVIIYLFIYRIDLDEDYTYFFVDYITILCILILIFINRHFIHQNHRLFSAVQR